jgi:hypothetical protein
VTVDQPVTIPLQWSHAQAAASYRIQLAVNASFSPAVMDTTITGDTTVTTPPLDYYKIYFWRVKAANAIGESDWTAYFRFRTVQVTDVAEGDQLPTSYALSQNFPNPFNPVTSIRFAVPQAGRVVITVFDLLGREETTLVDSDMPVGTYTVTWDATRVASGMYFYRMRAGDFVATKRMLLVR